jgi:hypothetical protein
MVESQEFFKQCQELTRLGGFVYCLFLEDTTSSLYDALGNLFYGGAKYLLFSITEIG